MRVALVLQYYPEPCSYPLLGATVHDIGRVGAVPGLRRAAQRRRLAAALEALLSVAAPLVATCAGTPPRGTCGGAPARGAPLIRCA